jgi:hypothetical protein
MSNQHTGNTQPSIDLEEHRSLGGVNAKAVTPYGFDGAGSLAPMPPPLVDKPYDYLGLSNADGNGNYQTLKFYIGGSGGTLQRTLTLTYDGTSNVTSITRS